MVQQENAGITVLGGDFPLCVKLLENRRHVAGGAVLRDGFGVVLGIDADLVLHGEVQQLILNPVTLKGLGGDALRVVSEGELVNLFDAVGVGPVLRVLLHGNGIVRLALRGERRRRQRAQRQHNGAKQYGDTGFHGMMPPIG